MSENLYEGLFLLDSGKFAADPQGATSEVLGILEKAGATVVANRPWADGKLAYEIEGRRKALHFLSYFRMPGSGMVDITRSCKLSDSILRHIVIKHPQTLFDAMVSAISGGDSASEGESTEKSKPAPVSTESASEDNPATDEAVEAASSGE